MLFAPRPIGKTTLDAETLDADRRGCRRMGPCGMGERAIYLGSRYFERRFYLPWGEAERVFKRVAMSSGGFSGKGAFGAMAYLVVRFGGGQEKQCYCKREEDVDRALEWIAQNRPSIPTHSAEAEKKLAAEAAEEEARFLKTLPAEAEAALETLRAAKKHLEKRPGLAGELVAAAKQKRVVDNLKPGYLIGGALLAALGVLAMLYGAWGLLRHSAGAGYFAAGGGVAFFTALASGVLPSRWTSKKYAQREWERVVGACRDYCGGHDVPVPPQYAHPIVLERMIRVVREGRAASAAAALAVVKDDLRALNSSVTVSQREHDEVATVKPLFLACGYRDEI